ncbi:MAG: tetratricopeptide repeat protein [Spirochaetia bacterium]|jgi:tetratricopeptide (TPR) repeat protein|nr:tetratricopeptide repeat protein [Spirochaetia bacterium]
MKKYILILLALSAAGCSKENKILYDNINGMDSPYLSAGELSAREKELKETISEYRDILEKKVDAARNLGTYHKTLGKLYLDNRMYLLAIEQFTEAIKIDNENPVLFYYAALAHARYAKSLMSETEKFANFIEAEKFYLRTLELNINFHKALYALSVLYVFELDQPDKAVSYLEQLLETQRSDYEAMFLLANAYIRIGLSDMAVEMYDRIIKNTKNSAYKDQAEANKKKLMDGGYEGI